MSETKNQGEGDRESGRRYDDHVREFVADGKVAPAANSAETFVDQHPKQAHHDEQKAKHGPHGVFEELVAKGKQIVERLKARFDKN
jgi:hypothetical protein